VDADRVEQFLPQQLGEFLGTVHSVHEDDHLVEGQGVQEMGQFLEFLVLVDIDVELGQAVEDEFTLIDEDLTFLLQKLLAVFLHLFRHSSTEHHHLLVMRGLDKDVLNVSTHLGIAQHLITLINDKELALIEMNQLVFGQVV
jgi:hypothetical protein